QILARHARGGKPLFKSSPNPAAIELIGSRNGGERLLLVVHNEARDAVIDHFGDGAPAEGNDRGATGHSFDHHQPKWLRPIDWEKQGRGIRKELGLALVVDLADQLNDIAINLRQQLLSDVSVL